jgi:hypothetical protein
MKFIRLIGFWLFMGCSFEGWAQADHFIYLQSDSKQPFYVKLSPTASPLASSNSGYLILPKIPQGTLSFWVGFPDNSFPEQHFRCPISADKGFLLKRFPEKGWALYDLQELTLTYANQADSTAPVQDSTRRQADAPVQTPAVAAADTTASQGAPAGTATTTAAPAAPKGDAFQAALASVTKDSTLTDIKYVKRPVAPPIVTKAGPDAGIVLVSRQVTDTGVKLVYADRLSTGAVDTVQMLVPQAGDNGATTAAAAGAVPTGGTTPVDTAAATGVATTTTAPAGVMATAPTGSPQDSATTALAAGFGVQPATATPDSTHGNGGSASPGTTDTSTKTTVNQSVTPVDTSHAFNPAAIVRTGKTKDTSNLLVPVFKQQDGSGTVAGQDSASRALASGFGVQPAATTSTTAGSKPQGLQMGNSNCTRVAGDEDYTKLRKRMASESDVDRMIELARKSFKKTCFTTEQVRNLSFLFLQEDGRYKFIEEAYPFVSDSWNFKSLQSLFSSAYFINRFKALVER